MINGVQAIAAPATRNRREALDLCKLESAAVELRARLATMQLIADHGGGTDIRTDPPELAVAFLNALREANEAADALHAMVQGEEARHDS